MTVHPHFLHIQDLSDYIFQNEYYMASLPVNERGNIADFISQGDTISHLYQTLTSSGIVAEIDAIIAFERESLKNKVVLYIDPAGGVKAYDLASRGAYVVSVQHNIDAEYRRAESLRNFKLRFNAEMPRIARLRVENNGIHLPVFDAFGEKLPDLFDMIIIQNASLYSQETLKSLLKTIPSRLQPDGTCILTMPEWNVEPETIQPAEFECDESQTAHFGTFRKIRHEERTYTSLGTIEALSLKIARLYKRHYHENPAAAWRTVGEDRWQSSFAFQYLSRALYDPDEIQALSEESGLHMFQGGCFSFHNIPGSLMRDTDSLWIYRFERA